MTKDNPENEEQRMRQAYLESMFETLEMLLNSTDELIAFADAGGEIIFINEPMAESMSLDRRECVGTTLWEYFEPEIAEKRKSFFRECLDTGRVVNFEDERNGKYFLTSFAPVGADKVIIMVRDITRRRRTEIALQESEEKYRTLVENAGDGIVIFSTEAILYANRRFGELTGFAPEHIAGTSFSLYLDPPERERFMSNIECVCSGEKDHVTFDAALKNRQSRTIDAEFKINTISYGGTSACLAFIRDISARVAAEEELRKHRDHLGELVSERTLELTLTNRELRSEISERKRTQESLQAAKDEAEFYLDLISHDLTNFNHALLGNIDLLERAAGGDEKARRLMNSCRRQIARSKLLISKVSAFSKIKDLEPGDLMRIDLNLCVAESIALMKKLYPGRDVQFVFEPGGEKLTLGAEIISAALNIVLENAVEHAGAQPVTVKIDIRPAESAGLEKWELAAADNGPGIPDEKKETVFEPAGESLKGLGLGLPLAAEVMKKLGGDLSIRDRTPGVPGRGALAVLTIPKA